MVWTGCAIPSKMDSIQRFPEALASLKRLDRYWGEPFLSLHELSPMNYPVGSLEALGRGRDGMGLPRKEKLGKKRRHQEEAKEKVALDPRRNTTRALP